MRFIWITAVKDWRRCLRNPVEIALWVGIPIIVGVLITLAFGGRSGPRPQAHVLVADNDDSILSGLLVGAMSQEAAGGFVRAEKVEETEGRKQMNKGKATALVVIPKGFSEAVLREEPATIELVTNPSESVLPGTVEEVLSILVDGTFYVHRLIGEDLKGFADGPPGGANTFPDETIAAFSTRINRLSDRLKGYLSPLVIGLETSVDKKDSDEPSFAFLLLPTILFMALLFMSRGLGDDLWEEKNRGTLRRVVSTPHSILSFLVGKVLSGAGVIFVVCLVALTVGYAYLRLGVATMPLALVWATLSGTMLATAMTAIQLYASSQRAGNILSLAIVFPLMMIGGSFFPFEVMPNTWMVAIGTRTPNGWALQRLKEIILGKAAAGGMLAAVALMLGMIVVLVWICAERMRRKFIQG